MPSPTEAPTKRRPKKTPPTFPQAPISELKRLRIFHDIPEQALLILQGSLRRASAEPDETILELSKQQENLFRYFFFIAKGQIKVLGLDEKARMKPLNFLRKGEFFVDKAFSWHGQVATKVVAISHVELFILPRDQLKVLAQQYPLFHKKIRNLSERIDYRNRLYCEDKYARSVLEFLIDTELTQASRVKITQMDKCIECNTCYESCVDRHGFQRLERGYARFGVLDFAQSCLTCFYPTCIPACPVDSVIYNSQKGEVEILDSCIGCQACARACQYGAIKMHKVLDGDSRFDRFVSSEKKIKPKFIADKCNHCYGHNDLACVSNCPTGAIIEVEATDLLENPRIFGVAEGVRRALPSLTESSWIVGALRNLYFLVGSLVTLLLCWEAYSLLKKPDLSFLLALQKSGWIAQSIQIEFKQGSDFCIFLGNVGFSLILLGLLYPLRKVFPRLFKYLGKKPAWLDFHNFCGATGTILVLFHTGFHFPLQPATFGYAFLVVVMLSGVFGRFLYQVIPRGVAGTELKMKDIEEEDAALTRKLDALLEGNKEQKETLDRIIAAVTEDASKVPSLWNLFKAVLMTRYFLWKLRFQPPRELRTHKRQIEIFLSLVRQKLRLKRNVAFLSMSSRLFIQWQYIHRPFAYLMCLIAISHIVYNLIFFKWNI